jgi:hypothetical protein
MHNASGLVLDDNQGIFPLKKADNSRCLPSKNDKVGAIPADTGITPFQVTAC